MPLVIASQGCVGWNKIAAKHDLYSAVEWLFVDCYL